MNSPEYTKVERPFIEQLRARIVSMDTTGTYLNCKQDGLLMLKINSRWEGEISDGWRYSDEFCKT